MNLHVALLTLALLSACGGSSPKLALAAPTAYTAVAGIPNASSMGRLILAGQPTEEQVAALGEAGVETMIDMCRPEERPNRDEAAEAEAAGIVYKHLPLSGADALTDAYMDHIRSELRAAENGLTVLHCRSANRVGAVMIPYLVLDQGRGLEQAIAEAKQIGLRSAALEAKAVAYTKAQQE